MTYSIHEIFPKPVFIKKNVCIEEELDNGLQYIRRRHKEEGDSVADFRTDLFEFRSSASWEANMHEAIEMKPIADKILNSAKEFAVELGYPEVSSRLFIRDMYSLIQDEGDFLHFHTHQGSFISGAFYFTSPGDSRLMFKRYDDNDRLPEKWNKINSVQTSFKIESNEIIMFKSNIVHGIPRCTENGKILVSFNIVMDPLDIYSAGPSAANKRIHDERKNKS
tara:strand:+ start:1073 stop:1738 length:666 start_codon:yes stop_codon:yes gene_type:complete